MSETPEEKATRGAFSPVARFILRAAYAEMELREALRALVGMESGDAEYDSLVYMALQAASILGLECGIKPEYILSGHYTLVCVIVLPTGGVEFHIDAYEEPHVQSDEEEERQRIQQFLNSPLGIVGR